MISSRFTALIPSLLAGRLPDAAESNVTSIKREGVESMSELCRIVGKCVEKL
jgi:hypothetical protein